MTDDHYCQKESELAEIKQLVKSLSSNEEKVLHNWHDVRALEFKQELYQQQLQNLQESYNEQHRETLQQIKEINECQQKLIIESTRTNKTFEDMKTAITLIPVLCTVLTFIITYVLR